MITYSGDCCTRSSCYGIDLSVTMSNGSFGMDQYIDLTQIWSLCYSDILYCWTDVIYINSD